MRCQQHLLTMLAVSRALQRALPRAHARRRVISMGLKTGIVGLPNVGKSTLFNALTGDVNAEAANYPFCTIEPNVGVVSVFVHASQRRPHTCFVSVFDFQLQN